MPLSDHEQRLLDQMERALKAEDPKFADSLSKPRGANIDRRGVIVGIAGVVLGLAVLVGGVATQFVAIGIVGFVLMLGGTFVAYRAASRTPTVADGESAQGSPPPVARPRRATKQSGAGFMGKLEHRWQQRKQRGQY